MDKHFVGGFCGGITGCVASYPVDTVKVRLQVGKLAMEGPTFRQVLTLSYYSSPTFRASFRGIASPLVTLAPSNAIVFFVENQVLNRLNGTSVRHHIVAGMAAGITQGVINSPTELIKIQMQVSCSTKYKSSFECAKSIYREHGLRKFGTGFRSTLAREIPAFGIYFGIYEALLLSAGYDNQAHGISETLKPFVCGGVAGVGSWYLTYPIDCVKTRIQANNLDAKTGMSMRTAWQAIKKDGVMYDDMALRSGAMKATLTRAFIANGVTFGTVALFLKAWDRYGRCC